MDKQQQVFIEEWHENFPDIVPPDLNLNDTESLEQEVMQTKGEINRLEERLMQAKFCLKFLETSLAVGKKSYEQKHGGDGSSLNFKSEMISSEDYQEGAESVTTFGHISHQTPEDENGPKMSPTLGASSHNPTPYVGVWECTSGTEGVEFCRGAHSVEKSAAASKFNTRSTHSLTAREAHLHEALTKSRSMPGNSAEQASVHSGDGYIKIWTCNSGDRPDYFSESVDAKDGIGEDHHILAGSEVKLTESKELMNDPTKNRPTWPALKAETVQDFQKENAGFDDSSPHVPQPTMRDRDTSDSSDLGESSSTPPLSGSPYKADEKEAKSKTFPGSASAGSPFHKLRQARTTNERIDALGGRESYYSEFEDDDFGEWVGGTPDQRSLNEYSDDGTDIDSDRMLPSTNATESLNSVTDRGQKPLLNRLEDGVNVDSTDNCRRAECDLSTLAEPDSSPTHGLPSNSENVSEMVDYHKVRSIAEAEKLRMRKWVISSLLDSEEMFLEYLNTLLLYMKPLKATITTSMPVMSNQDFDTLFYRVNELHSLHAQFYKGLVPRLKNWNADTQIGDLFLKLLSKLNWYEDYVNNYKKAQHTVEKCAKENEQFAVIIEGLKVKSRKREDLESISLIDILYKPVERVMRNTLVLQDILKHTPHRHTDYRTLRQALKQAQQFLNRINASSSASRGRKAISSASQAAARSANRDLVKDGYLVEVSPESGAQRKLRHVFLFNDLLLCAKQKQGAGMFHSKESYECKWYIPLADLSFKSNDDSEGTFEARETSEEDLRELSNRSIALKREIAHEKKQLAKRKGQSPSNSGQGPVTLTSKQLDRSRKKLNEVEAQIILSAPSLPLRIYHMQGKSYIFLMSSDYERVEWTEAIIKQQESCFKSFSLASIEVQSLLAACVKKRKVSKVGSMLTNDDEDLLFGYLTVTVHSGEGFLHPCNPYVTLEVDSYGHFQTKAKTRFCENTQNPTWETEFELEVDGAQTLRILCYDRARDHTAPYNDDVLIVKGKVGLDNGSLRNQEWIQVNALMNEIQIKVSFKFMIREQTLRRLPSRKANGVFGVKIESVTKRERGHVPSIVKHCVQEIERRGMDDVGIYRVSGVASEVKELKAYFEAHRKDISLLLSNIDVNAVAGVLKLYFRELPQPLFTNAKYSDFVGAVHLTDPETKHSTIWRLLADLPAANYHTLVYLREHLLKVAEKNSINKMTLHNLATVFGPTLLRPADDSSKKNTQAADAMLSALRMDVHHQVGVLLYCLELPKMPELGAKTTGSKLIAEARKEPSQSTLTVPKPTVSTSPSDTAPLQHESSSLDVVGDGRLDVQKSEKPPKLGAAPPSASRLRKRFHDYEEVTIGLSGKSPPSSTNNNNNCEQRSSSGAAVPAPRSALMPKTRKPASVPPKPSKPTPAPRRTSGLFQ